MVPFVLAQPSRSPFSAVPWDVVEPSRRRDLAFFAARDICFGQHINATDPTRMSATATYSTKQIITIGPVDEKSVEQIDDNNSD